MRFSLLGWVPNEEPLIEELHTMLAEQIPDEEKRAEILAATTAFLPRDTLHRRRTGQRKSSPLFEGKVLEYIRVEPLSSVLTFLVILATLVTAAASLIAIVVGEP